MAAVRAVLSVLAVTLALAACTGGSPAGSGSPSGSASGFLSVAPGTPNHVEDLPAERIVAESKAAAKAATSVHVTGTQNATTLDLRVGPGVATGTVSQSGITAELLSVGGTTYIKGDKEFWDESAGPGSGDVLAGKWVVAGSTAGDQSGITGFTDIGRLFDQVVTPGGTLTKGSPTTLDGTRVIGITDSQDGSTLYVALEGPPYPVTIRPPGSTTPPPTFSAWNAPLTVHSPTADEIVDPSKLGG